MKLASLMESFAKRLGLHIPAPDASGVYTFEFDEIPVHGQPGPNHTLILYGVIGDLPEDTLKADEQLKGLLKLNLAQIKNHADVISLGPGNGEMTLHRQLDLTDLDTDSFEPIMENFVNALEYWQLRYQELSAPTASPDAGIFLDKLL